MQCTVAERSSFYAGLHGKPLDLATRLDIAIDVAHAVTYLHMYSGVPKILLSYV